MRAQVDGRLVNNGRVMELVRCYVGFRLPAELGPKLAETQMTIRKKAMSDAMRWNGPGELVFNLCALGEQPWEMVQRATSVLGPICEKYAAPRLVLESLAGIPNATQPRYVNINIGGDTEIVTALQAELAKSLFMLMTANEKGFVPQVTLGRLKIESEQARTMLGRALRLIPSEALGEWRPTAVEVMRTVADSTGVHYETVQKFQLAAPVTA